MRRPDLRPHGARRASRTTPRRRPGLAPVRGAVLMPLAVLVASLLTGPVAPASAQDPASAPADVTGRWMFVIESGDTTTANTIAVPVVFEQDGENVTGTVQMPDIQGVESAEITDGRYVDGTLTFVLRVGAGDQVFSAEVEAEVEGDEMAGEARVAGLERTAVFRATRVG